MTPEHYFSAEPASDPSARRTVQVQLAGRDVEVTTGAGVFSADRLDLGTRVLLRTVPAPPAEGELLDLGCGWGPIALTMAMQSPAARVWAVDVNARARELTALNADRLRLAVTVAAPEEVPPELTFSAIWSNPPIRIGKQALHDLLLAWLPRLRSDGIAYLVVQRHLGADSLQRWLNEALPTQLPGFEVVRSGSAKGYRVLQVAAKPDRAVGVPGR